MSMIEAAENRLWAAVNTRAGGRPLDDACDAALYNFIRAGIAHLEHANQLDDGAHLALAEQNIIRFLDAMPADSADGIVPEQAFWHTWQLLCPLWPFCDRVDTQGEYRRVTVGLTVAHRTPSFRAGTEARASRISNTLI